MIIDHAGLEFEVEVTAYDGGRPAYISGPPEDCYPEEFPDFEYSITSVTMPDSSEFAMGEIDEDEFERLVLEAYKESLDDDCY